MSNFGAVAGRTWTVGATTTGGPKHDVLQIPQEFHAVDLVLREELLKKYGHKLEGTTTRTWNSAAILPRERAGKHLRTRPLSWLAAGGVHNHPAFIGRWNHHGQVVLEGEAFLFVRLRPWHGIQTSGFVHLQSSQSSLLVENRIPMICQVIVIHNP